VPAENRMADVFRAVGTFGERGGLLEEIAVRAGVSPKTAKRHLKALLRDEQINQDTLRDGSRRRVYLGRDER